MATALDRHETGKYQGSLLLSIAPVLNNSNNALTRS